MSFSFEHALKVFTGKQQRETSSQGAACPPEVSVRSIVFTVGIDSSSCMPLSLATWADCGEMD